jgi:hypothetical protein
MRRRQAAAAREDAIVTESAPMPPLADAQPPMRRTGDL